MPQIIVLLLMLFQPNNQDAFIKFEPNLACQKVGFWVLKDEVIPIIQQKLKPFIQQQLGADHIIIKNWKDYRFQILGRTSPKGEKEIFINAICQDYFQHRKEAWPDTPPLDLRTDPVSMHHGGNCNFMVIMDPITLAITDHFFTSQTLKDRQ